MSKSADSRPYFRVEKYQSTIHWAFGKAGGRSLEDRWRIVSIAGGDIVADCIPSADLAEAARKGMEESRK